MPEADPVHRADQKENENELDQNTQSDLETLNFLWFRFLGDFSHWSQPPFARLERLISQSQHQCRHTEIEDDRSRIDDSA